MSRQARRQPDDDGPAVDELADALDWAAIGMLREIDSAGGAATTVTLREETGLDNQRVAHRRRRLAELGLIEVEDAEEYPEHYPNPPRKHILTEKGEQALEEGLLAAGEAPTPEDFSELASLAASLHSDLRDHEERLAEVEDRADTAGSKLAKARGRSHRSLAARLDSLEERLDALAAELEEHDERISGKRDKRGGFLG